MVTSSVLPDARLPEDDRPAEGARSPRPQGEHRQRRDHADAARMGVECPLHDHAARRRLVVQHLDQRDVVQAEIARGGRSGSRTATARRRSAAALARPAAERIEQRSCHAPGHDDDLVGGVALAERRQVVAMPDDGRRRPRRSGPAVPLSWPPRRRWPCRASAACGWSRSLAGTASGPTTSTRRRVASHERAARERQPPSRRVERRMHDMHERETRVLRKK